MSKIVLTDFDFRLKPRSGLSTDPAVFWRGSPSAYLRFRPFQRADSKSRGTKSVPRVCSAGQFRASKQSYALGQKITDLNVTLTPNVQKQGVIP